MLFIKEEEEEEGTSLLQVPCFLECAQTHGRFIYFLNTFLHHHFNADVGGPVNNHRRLSP